MESDPARQVFVLFMLLILSGFFSCSETALTSINKIKLSHMVENGSKRAGLVRQMLDCPDRLLTTILIGNNIVNITASVMAASIAVAIWGQKGLLIVTICLTAIILLFGEIIPKSIAVRYPETVSLLVISLIKVISWLLAPVVMLTSFLIGLLARLFGLPDKENETFITAEEFNTMIDLGKKEGIFEEQEGQMLQGVAELKEKQVKEILKTHRLDVVGIPCSVTYNDLVKLIAEMKLSRYPVYKGTVDNIVGILHVKDLFQLSESEKHSFDVLKVMRKAIFVPETKNINSLFSTMKQERNHIAVVLDEYCGTQGIVTLEDILETIVGEIEDETDLAKDKMIFEMDEKSALVNPNIQIHSFNEQFGVNIPNGDIETLGGFILKQLDRLPVENDTLIWEDLRLVVEAMEGNRIDSIRVNRIKNS